MSEINVINKTQRIIVDMPTRSVSVILAGPQGPAGEISTATLKSLAASSADFTEFKAAVAAL